MSFFLCFKLSGGVRVVVRGLGCLGGGLHLFLGLGLDLGLDLCLDLDLGLCLPGDLLLLGGVDSTVSSVAATVSSSS